MLRMAIFLIFISIVVTGWMFFRIGSADHDPEVWHVDPLAAVTPDTPNSYRVAPEGLTEEYVDAPAPVYTANPTLMAKAFDDFVMAQNKVERIAGSAEEGWVTYVQKSNSWNFPDYISVKFIDLNGGSSTVAIFSRSRFGHSDMGVNKERVETWLKSLQGFEQ